MLSQLNWQAYLLQVMVLSDSLLDNLRQMGITLRDREMRRYAFCMVLQSYEIS